MNISDSKINEKLNSIDLSLKNNLLAFKKAFVVSGVRAVGRIAS